MVLDDLYVRTLACMQKQVNIEVLRRKHVILLISGLDIHQDEIIILSHYQAELADPLVRQGQEKHYEMVWLPIVDNVAKDQYSPEENRRDFERLQAMMIWYTVLDPFAIEPAVIEFVKNIWHFEKRPIAVSLDPQGRVASENALPMMWIWGNLPFPFSKEREEALWKSAYATWRLELLVDSIDPRIINWVYISHVLPTLITHDIYAQPHAHMTPYIYIYILKSLVYKKIS